MKRLNNHLIKVCVEIMNRLGIGPEGALLMARVGIRIYNLILKAMGL